MPIISIFIFITFFITIFLFWSLLFHLITKLYKIPNTHYKTAIKISAIQFITVLILGFIGGIFSLGSLLIVGIIIEWILPFLTLHFLLKKFYLSNFKKNLFVYIMTIIVTLFISIPAHLYIAEPFYMAGDSMKPTIKNNEYIYFKKFDKEYGRGDIITMRNPNNMEEIYIKRIIGLPEEKIKIKNGVITIYNQNYSEGKILEENYLGSQYTGSTNEEIIEIEKGKYFVLGDNRNESTDSRNFGAISSYLINGKYWFSIPFSNKKVQYNF